MGIATGGMFADTRQSSTFVPTLPPTTGEGHVRLFSPPPIAPGLDVPLTGGAADGFYQATHAAAPPVALRAPSVAAATPGRVHLNSDP